MSNFAQTSEDWDDTLILQVFNNAIARHSTKKQQVFQEVLISTFVMFSLFAGKAIAGFTRARYILFCIAVQRVNFL